MKFTIRFADKIVGVLIILALAAVVFVVFMLGSSQRWFSHDYQFITYFDSATGLSQNMPLQYKGFTIGRIKSFDLTDDDRVEVKFIIFDTYIHRATKGSLVEMMMGPIPMLGNQFLFHPGLGLEPLAEGDFIPSISSPEGEQMLADGLGFIPKHDDTIALIISQVNATLANVNKLLAELNGAFVGTDATSLGRTMGGVERITRTVPADITRTVDTVTATVDTIMGDLRPILANLEALSADLANPDGTVAAILNAEGPVYTNLVSSLESVSGTLRNLERTTDFIPAQLPQVAAMIIEIRTVLESVDKVLIALTNNPLLKNGVPARVETQPTGTSLRDINF